MTGILQILFASYSAADTTTTADFLVVAGGGGGSARNSGGSAGDATDRYDGRTSQQSPENRNERSRTHDRAKDQCGMGLRNRDQAYTERVQGSGEGYRPKASRTRGQATDTTGAGPKKNKA